MRTVHRTLAQAAVTAAALFAAFAGTAAAQTSAPSATSRTPDGHPDLQGLWYFGSATPLERPRDMADKPFLTPDEARAFERREAERISKIVAVHPPEWLDYGPSVGSDLRSSLIVDPPDGRVPPL